MKLTPLPRKAPSQDRSRQMFDDILSGAIRVLKREGGQRFTTIRVAEEAGVSVGSLYQYFPNKEAILFQVQYAEWQATSARLAQMIAQRSPAPEQRLRRLIRAFFQSEWEEKALRRALAETGLRMDDTEQFRALRTRVLEQWAEFLGEINPASSRKRRREWAAFVFTTIGALAEQVTGEADSADEVQRWAKECAAMVLAYLRGGNS